MSKDPFINHMQEKHPDMNVERLVEIFEENLELLEKRIGYKIH